VSQYELVTEADLTILSSFDGLR